MLPELITIGTFALLVVAVFVGIQWATRRSRATAEDGSSVSPPGRIARSLAGAVPQSEREVDSISRDLSRAGQYHVGALVEYLAVRNALVLGSLISFGTLAVLADPGTALPRNLMIVGLITAAFSYGMPRMALSLQAKARLSRIERGLPDALDLVRMCLTGGLPLRDALQRVSTELGFAHPDVALEFTIISRQADANSMTRAMRSLAERIDLPDIRALSMLISQTERMGTHVSTAVADFADSMRRVCRQRAQEQSGKSSIKLLFPVILCLTPPIFILLAGPPILQLRSFLIEENRPGGLLNPDMSSVSEPLDATLLNR